MDQLAEKDKLYEGITLSVKSPGTNFLLCRDQAKSIQEEMPIDEGRREGAGCCHAGNFTAES